MSSRREVLTELQPGSTTHAGLWLDKGLADVAAKDGHPQAHFEALMRSIKIPGAYRDFFRRWREHVAFVPPFTTLAEAQVRGRLIVGPGAEIRFPAPEQAVDIRHPDFRSTVVTSVWTKSSPLKRSGSPVEIASAYEKQSP